MDENSNALTRSQAAARELTAYLKARNALIWIVTREESRAEYHIVNAARDAKYVTRFWDCSAGVTNLAGKPEPFGSPDPGDILTAIRERSESGREMCVWVLRDLPSWLDGPIGMTTRRSLRNLARDLPRTELARAQAVVIVTTQANVPDDLSDAVKLLSWPLPDRQELGALLDSQLGMLPEEARAKACGNGERETAIDAAIGLSGEEATACYARSLVTSRRIDPVAVANEKKRVIARERVLEWYDPLPGGLAAVGGLDILKSWVLEHAEAYSADARSYGLSAPRGLMLVGMSGCGKSLTAKAVATALGGVPLLRWDFGALKDKFVGASEANFRKSINVIESIGRCVVWIDEIEKSLAGATQGAADGGVAADALGQLLSWMQERQGESFVVATANDVSKLPPELLRKGRFDEVFFIDLPIAQERREILKAAMRAHRRDPVILDDAERLVDATDGFTGSEIAQLVPDALFIAYRDGRREVETEDLLTVAKAVVPLAKTSAETVDRLRQWGSTRARRATSPSEATSERQSGFGRSIDI